MGALLVGDEVQDERQQDRDRLVEVDQCPHAGTAKNVVGLPEAALGDCPLLPSTWWIGVGPVVVAE
jgi:hypothetical protein